MKKLLMILSLPVFIFSCQKNQTVELPVMTLIGPLEVFFDLNAAYVEFGYKATDAAGRDITDSVIRDLSSLNMARTGTYRISYTAVDRLGNKSAAVYRTVHVGIGRSPVISIAGDNPVLLALNSEFTPPSATAVSSDGNTDLSESVIVNSENVDTSKPGTYSVYYTVSDTGGITATEVLTVYVLESAVPRIVISGAGTTADNPLIIEQMTFDEEVGDEEKLSAAAAAFEKALPVMKAYDLEDGDISYRISVTEDEAYQAVLQAVLDGTTPSDPVTLTASDNDGNVSSVTLYISVIKDNTPPVITIADEQAVYEIEIDMWTDQWSTAWEAEILNKLSVSVSDDGGDTIEIFPKEGTSEESAVATGSGIKCWIEYPSVVNSTNQQEYPNSDLKTTLKHSTGENTACYYYQTPTHEINTKTVTLKAKDVAGNTGEKSIKVFLKDTTPPEISTTSVTVNFGATQFSYNVKDNSGYTEIKNSNIPSYKTSETEYPMMSLIEGKFVNKISFSATDSSNNSVSKNGTLIVKAPDTSNLFPYSNFSGSQTNPAGEPITDTTNLGSGTTYHSPNGWQLKAYDGSDSVDNAAFMTTHASAGKIQGMLHGYSGYLICGTVCRNNKYAYATTGFRAYKSGLLDRKITNMNLGLQASATMILYDTVTYSFSYDSVDFHTSGGVSFSPGNRNMTFTVQTGNGKLNGKSSVVIERIAQCGTTDMFLYNAMDSGEWTTSSVTATVSGGNISAISVLFSIGKPDVNYHNPNTYVDYGTLTNNVTIKVSNWNKLQPDGTVAPANGS